MQALIGIFRLIKDQKTRLYQTIFLNTFLGLGALAPAYFLKLIVDGLIAVSNGSLVSTHVTQLTYLLVGLAAVRVAMAVAGYLQERLGDLLRLDAVLEVRYRMFEHVLGLSIDYYESNKVGETVQRITESVYQLGVWLMEISETVLLRVLTVLLSTGVVFVVQPAAGAVMLVMVVLILGLSVKKKQITRPIRKDASRRLEQVQGHVSESIQNLTTLRAFGGERGALKSYEASAYQLREARLAQNRVEWRYNAVIELVEGLGIVAVMAIIARTALGGEASAGDIVLVALYLQQVVSNVRPLAGFIDRTGEFITSAERMLELLEVEPTIKDAPGAVELGALESLEFKGVHFTYPGHSDQVLKDISFKLQAGRMLALVGPSGTGKTTIVKLLLRLYEPTKGEILINNQPVHAFTGASIREHIGTVMQDVALFNDTLAQNVRLAKTDASPADLAVAISRSHAAEFVDRLPDGDKTLVGERGIKLSGGQKQRVAIARAILKQPSLVILDEATSALDSASELQVQAGLNELMAGRMAVVIAHRLSTVKQAQHILVIQRGRVVESGTHGELLLAKGMYAKLFSMQSS